MRILSPLIAAGLLLAGITVSGAATATAEVTWEEPENYTDVRASYLTQGDQFQSALFNRLTRHFDRLSDMHFPEGYVLKVTVHDLSIGGDMRTQFGPGKPEQVRVRMANDSPAMTLDFALVNEQGETISQGEGVEIKGRTIRTEGRSRFPNLSRRDQTMIGSEARMINRWFKETFLDS